MVPSAPNPGALGFHHEAGTALWWDGKSLPVQWLCVKATLQDCSGPTVPGSVRCDVPPGTEISVQMDYYQRFDVGPERVDWYRAKGDTVSSNGGVRNFDVRKGADVNVVFTDHQAGDTHHLSGHISCA
jgi:hypothetical protein